MSAEELEQPGPLRVVVVDHDEAMRMLLRLQLELDGRFEVVAEGTDGAEAVALAEQIQPDLVVMALYLSGPATVQAVAEVRERAPGVAVILYTLQTDAGTYQAAMAAGATDILDRDAAAKDVVGALLDRTAPEGATLEVHVGPVSAEAARTWVANTETILDAVTANPDVVGVAVPDDVLAFFRSTLRQFAVIAHSAEEFRWAARARPEDVSRVVSYWGFIDDMSEAQLQQLGVQWASPEGDHPFFRALTAGVLDALRRHEETQRLASRLAEQWR